MRAERARGREEEAPASRHAALEILKDNLEAFTVALVMALVIKHFCVEAFKIPTGSMMPTLRGDKEAGEGRGDRILVDKWAYLFRGPARWDVMVFRYPLDESKHFIKRVAGLGGEWFKIHEGDVWTRPDREAAWDIATKRARAREELYHPVYPPPPSDVAPVDGAFAAWWEVGDGWTVAPDGTLRHAGGTSGEIAFAREIGNRTDAGDRLDAPAGRPVHDIRFRARVRPEGTGALQVVWATHVGETTTLDLRAADAETPSQLAIRRLGFERVVDLPVGLEPGRTLDLVLEAVDGEARLSIDGREVARLDAERQPDDPEVFSESAQRLAVRAEGVPVALEDVRVDRDTWYRDDGDARFRGDGLRIPDDHYFMLGDNTASSSDSRRWTIRCVQLQDGREICWDATTAGSGTSPRYGEDGLKHVVDLTGVEQAWREEDEDPSMPYRSAEAPFVPRRLVVGRAFLVFWPLLPDFPGRLGFIH